MIYVNVRKENGYTKDCNALSIYVLRLQKQRLAKHSAPFVDY